MCKARDEMFHCPSKTLMKCLNISLLYAMQEFKEYVVNPDFGPRTAGSTVKY